MDKFIKLSTKERKSLFEEAANRLDVTPIIIEKDFWVCWVLSVLYSIPDIAPYIIFKGGTSLSKVYKLIYRFSEDIDLAIDKKIFEESEGYILEKGISNKQKKKLIEGLVDKSVNFIHATIMPKLQSQFEQILGNSQKWQLSFDTQDNTQQTILFTYPRALDYEIGNYIQPSIKLEFGARGSAEPHYKRTVIPYIAELFPIILNSSPISVNTLDISRTFWEKITILHAIYHNKKSRAQISRHYYDLYMITQSEEIITKVLKDVHLLEEVAHHKENYFRDLKASYHTAKIGTLKLVPNEEILKELEKDYKKMESMFMQSPPTFKQIVDNLLDLEQKLNSLK